MVKARSAPTGGENHYPSCRPSPQKERLLVQGGKRF